MMKMLLSLLIALILSSTTLLAQEMRFCNVKYSVFGNYLYWKVARGDLDTLSDPKQYANPNYHSGYRVGGSAEYRSWELALYYTHLDISTDQNFSSTTNSEDVFYAMSYQMTNIELGHSFSTSCIVGSLRPYLGARRTLMDEKLVRTIIGDSTTRSDLEMIGYGPYGGLEGKLRLFSCPIPIYLMGNFNIGFLNSVFSHTDNGVKTGDEDNLLSTQQGFVGCDFPIDCQSLKAHVQIGYEAHGFNSYRKVTGSSDHASCGVSGLVVHFQAIF